MNQLAFFQINLFNYTLDLDAYNRGELVEPIKPIIYYLDPGTPIKWRKYFKLELKSLVPLAKIGFCISYLNLS